MEKAAVKIQAGFRGFKARKEIKYYTVFSALFITTGHNESFILVLPVIRRLQLSTVD